MAKILVIDDYRDIVDSLKGILELDGHNILCAYSAEEGLECLKTQKPDLVLSDVVMPKMNGIELVEKVKALCPGVEIILMTGHGTVQSAIEGLTAGAFDFILKPINFDALKFDIRRVFEKRSLAEKLQIQQAKMVQLAKLTAVGQLGAGVAHEMNQPLMAMSAYLESLLMDEFVLAHPVVKDKILKIKDQFTRLGTIVRRMHDYAGSRTAGFVMEAVNRPLHDGYYILKQQITNHGIVLKEELDADLPKVFMDRYQIQDIVINFLINAMDALDDRFHKADGGEMTLISKKLKNHEAVLVGVIDNGIPVGKGTEADIFNPFFTTKQPGKGTGLGLSVSHGIVQNHSGLISFQPLSRERKIFYFVLPVNKDQVLSEDDDGLVKDIKGFLGTL